MAESQQSEKGTSHAAEQPAKFPVARLIRDSFRFLGHPSHVAAGALHGSKKSEMTVDEAKAAVEKWLKTPLTKKEA